MRITIVGAGYVGLLSGVCLAAKAHTVTLVDVNRQLIDQINAGTPPIHEPGLHELLGQTLKEEKLAATTNLELTLDQSELVLIAVGTPTHNGAIDLSYIIEVARAIGHYLKSHDRYLSVVIKSTVIPGTTDTLLRSEIAGASGKEFPSFGLGMNPEFLREGNAIEDFMQPDRIVLGYEDDRTLRLLQELYAPWQVEKIAVNSRTAELIKYANNVLLATQISTSNEIANLAAALGGIDVMDVVRAVHLDKRWNPIVGNDRALPAILSYLVPGCGFGGSCFPKDLQALRAQGIEHGLPMHMLNAVLEVNDSQPEQVIATIESEIGNLSGKRVLVLGLAFKPGTDDVRESAALKIVQSLLAKGAQVSAHDPVATKNYKAALGPTADAVSFVSDWIDHVEASNIVLVTTAWPEYRQLPDLNLAGKMVFDARRMFRPTSFATGTYYSVGRRIAAKEQI